MITKLDGTTDWPAVIVVTWLIIAALGSVWTYAHWAHYGELSAEQKLEREQIRTCRLSLELDVGPYFCEEGPRE